VKEKVTRDRHYKKRRLESKAGGGWMRSEAWPKMSVHWVFMNFDREKGLGGDHSQKRINFCKEMVTPGKRAWVRTILGVSRGGSLMKKRNE